MWTQTWPRTDDVNVAIGLTKLEVQLNFQFLPFVFWSFFPRLPAASSPQGPPLVTSCDSLSYAPWTPSAFRVLNADCPRSVICLVSLWLQNAIRIKNFGRTFVSFCICLVDWWTRSRQAAGLGRGSVAVAAGCGSGSSGSVNQALNGRLSSGLTLLLAHWLGGKKKARHVACGRQTGSRQAGSIMWHHVAEAADSNRQRQRRRELLRLRLPTPSPAPNRVVACHKPKPPNATTACSNCRTICQRDTQRRHTPPSLQAAHVPICGTSHSVSPPRAHRAMASTTCRPCGCQAAHGGCHSFRKSTSTIGNDNSPLVPSASLLGNGQAKRRRARTHRPNTNATRGVTRRDEARRGETTRDVLLRLVAGSAAAAWLLRFQLIINVDVG